MIYLKEFSTENDYKAYRDGAVGGGYIKPNVSLCDDNDKVHYNLNTNGHPYVDLDLPSGTLWATMNVGAKKPSESGLYFQWGDASGYTADQVGNGEGQKKFASDWSDYKWNASVGFSKYNTAGDTLDLEDDAANANMGGTWHMPTPQQIQELLDNTTSVWTTQDEVNGRLFTSTKDTSKSIFIPAACSAWDGSLSVGGGYGSVWSSVLRAGGNANGQGLYFNSGNVGLYGYNRYRGFSVRGVLG